MLPSLHPFDLSIEPAISLVGEVAEHASPALAAVAGRLARTFLIRSPFAPAFCCIGAELPLDAQAAAANGASRVSVTGNGETARAALTACLGEAADLASQFEREGDVVAHGPAAGLPTAVAGGWLSVVGAASGGDLDWVAAIEAGSDRAVLLPADLCLRRLASQRAIEPVGALSSGAAAGPTRAAAALRALLELCERDAAAMWWLGGRLPRSLPQSSPAGARATALLARLRAGQAERRSILLDITTELGVPTFAAVSTDEDGRGLACGLAARLDPGEAVQAAILEMCQMEMSAPLAAAKRAERGEAGLNEADRRHLARASFAAGDLALLHPPEASRSSEPPDWVGGGLDGLLAHLKEQGIDVFLHDLTRPDIGVPVMRALAPHLQPFAATVITERLQRCRRAAGANLVEGVPLF